MAECEHETSAGARFCATCGVSLEHRCASCDDVLPPEAQFCPSCGLRVEAGSTGSADQHPPVIDASGERRQLTVLFCDLAGSTTLANRLDPEEHKDVVDGYYEIVGRTVADHGGHVGTYLGDGVLAFFGYPVSLDDNTVRAVRAGLDIQERIAEANAAGGIRGEKIAARVGVHVGLVVLDEMGVDSNRGVHAMGDAVNTAARVQDAAPLGSVVITAAAADRVVGAFDLEEIGPVALKGLAEPHHLHQVIGRSAETQPNHSGVFVGRSAEVELLGARWALARDGRGQVVVLAGDPGIGKSRLLAEVEARIEAPWRPVRCSAYDDASPFALARALLEERLAGTDLATLCASVEGDPQEGERLLGALLSGSDAAAASSLMPAAARTRTIEWLAAVLVRPTDEPSVLVVEDVHWADPSSMEVVSALVERITGTPSLLVLTARPEFAAPWSDGSNRLTLWLSRLSDDDVRSLVHAAAGGSDLTSEQVAAIVDRTDGVPLFAEELARSVAERLKDTAWIPVSLSDSLLARLDRLGDQRTLAQIAAVIGREFAVADLQEVHGGEADLVAGLRALDEAEVIEALPGAGVGWYRFRHALIQQAAYDSLLLRTRREAHQRVAEVLDARDAQPEAIARHWGAADQPENAVRWWTTAADGARLRVAHVEAAAHLDAAVTDLRRLPETDGRHRTEIDLQLKLASSSQFTKGFAAAEVQSSIERAIELSETVGDAASRVSTLYGLLTTTTSSGQIDALPAIADRLRLAAETSGAPGDLALAAVGMASNALNQSRFLDATRSAAAGLELIDRDVQASGVDLHDNNRVLGQLYGALSSSWLGDEEGLARFGDPLLGRAAVSTDDAVGDLLANNMALILVQQLGALADTIETADRVRQGAIDLGLDFLTVFADLYGGWAQALSGDTEGAHIVERGIQLQLSSQQFLYLDDSFRALAEAQLHVGRVDAAAETIGQAVGHVVQRHHEIGVYRVRAEIAAARGVEPSDIEADYRRADAAADALESPTGKASVALSKARWLVGRDRVDEAFAVVGALRPVGDAFPVGRLVHEFVSKHRGP